MDAQYAAVCIQKGWRTHLLVKLREAQHQQFVRSADEPTQEELDEERENKLNFELGFPIYGIQPKTRRQLQREQEEEFLRDLPAMEEKYPRDEEEENLEDFW